MEWFKFHTEAMADPVVAAATDAAVGAWLRLLASCYRHCNGGCYRQCRTHSHRQWMSIACVDADGIAEAVSAGLARWSGDDLEVYLFDSEQQNRATSRSENGRKMALLRWSHAQGIASGNSTRNAEESRVEEKRGEERKIEKTPLPPVGGSEFALSPPEPTKVRKPKAGTETPGFLRFWAAYPNKVAKGAAARAWPGDDLTDSILAALEWQVPTWTDPRYIAHPATWLNARRWLDEKTTMFKQHNRDPSVGHYRATVDEEPLVSGRIEF